MTHVELVSPSLHALEKNKVPDKWYAPTLFSANTKWSWSENIPRVVSSLHFWRILIDVGGNHRDRVRAAGWSRGRRPPPLSPGALVPRISGPRIRHRLSANNNLYMSLVKWRAPWRYLWPMCWQCAWHLLWPRADGLVQTGADITRESVTWLFSECVWRPRWSCI